MEPSGAGGRPSEQAPTPAVLDLGPRFRVTRRLGEGGMGVVVAAWDSQRGEEVAIKITSGLDPSAIWRFKREFRALADVRHPNLVRMHELVATGGGFLIVMELVHGTSILEWVRPGEAEASTAARSESEPARDGDARDDPTLPSAATPRRGSGRARLGALDAARLRAALVQLARGLGALHAAGHLHRDVKPSNVLVTHDGRVALLDFGLVGEPASIAAEADMVLGTAAYMSPEQARGAPLGPPTDWYGVGVLLYEALSGQLPFSGAAGDVLWSKQRRDPPAPSQLRDGVPADLDALCIELLRRSPEQRPDAEQVLARLGARGTPRVPADAPRTRFVGRSAELAALDGAFRAASGGHAVTVLVEAASGMGKTTLVRRFLADLAAQSRAVILQSRCYERESVPFEALDGLVDALAVVLAARRDADVEPLLPPSAGLLPRVFPVLGRVSAIARAAENAPRVRDSHELRWRAFGALRVLLGALAARGGMVLFVDDLQWGDVEGAAFLADLGRPPALAGLLSIVAFRREDAAVSPPLRALAAAAAPGSGVDQRRIVLEPLTAPECVTLALGALGSADNRGRELADAVAREAQGSPLFVDTLVEHAREGAALGVTLEQALEARFARLDPGARRLLELVAVAARPIRQRIAARASAAGAGFASALDALRGARLVRGWGGDDPWLEVYHDRIREAAVVRLEGAALAGAHRSLAEALQACGEDDAEELATHWAGAGDADATRHWAARAAESAERALDFERAAALWKMAAAVASGADAIGLGRRLGDALVAAGRGTEAAAEYLRLADAGAEDALELRRRAAEQLLRSGRLEAGLGVLRSVLGAIGVRVPSSRAATAVSLITQRARIALRGLDLVERAPAPSEIRRVDVLRSAATSLGLVDTLRGADLHARHLLAALDAGEPWRASRALAGEAIYAAAGGDAPEAEALVVRIAELAERVGEPHARAMAVGIRGAVAFLLGRLRQAFEDCERAEHLLRTECTGVAWDVGSAQIFSLSALAFMGRLRELGARVPVLVQQAERRGDLYTATVLRSGNRNLAWLAAGDVAESERQVARAAADWPSGEFHLEHYFLLSSRTQIDLYQGRPRAALARLVAAWPEVTRSMLLRVRVIEAELRWLRGVAALGSARRAREPRSLLRSADTDAAELGRLPIAWAGAHAMLLRAASAALRGESEDASDRFERAERAYEKHGMALHAAACRMRRGELSGGREGRALCASATAACAAESVSDPERFLAILVPRLRRA